jgi:hypothetical protein
MEYCISYFNISDITASISYFGERDGCGITLVPEALCEAKETRGGNGEPLVTSL